MAADPAGLTGPSPLAPWLPPGWRVLGRCRFGTAMPGPLSTGCHAVAHPAVGIALLDRVPDATPNAEARLRRALGTAEFWPDFPGNLPVWHGRIDTADLRGLDALLQDQFALLPPLTVAGGPAWVTAVDRALAADPAWEVVDRPPRPATSRAVDEAPAAGRARSRTGGGRRAALIVAGGLLTFVVGVLSGLALLPTAPAPAADANQAAVQQSTRAATEAPAVPARPVVANPVPAAPLRAAAITSPTATTSEADSPSLAPPSLAPPSLAPLPAMTQMGAPQTGASQLGTSQSGTSQSAASQPETLQPRTSRPGMPQPDGPSTTQAPANAPTTEATISAPPALPPGTPREASGPPLAVTPTLAVAAAPVVAPGTGSDAPNPSQDTVEAALPPPPPVPPSIPGTSPAASGNRPVRQAATRPAGIDRACSRAVFRYQQGETLSAVDAGHVRNGCATRR